MKQYWQLFLTFFKIGTFTIGGGYAMIPLIQKEIVDKLKWIHEKEFLDILSIAQSVPGAISVNTAIFIGYKMKGLKGVFCSIIGCILPSFVSIIIIAMFFAQFKENQYIIKIFKGVRPAVVALMIYSLWKIAKTSKLKWITYFLSATIALIIFYTQISPILIIIAVIIFCIIFQYFTTKKQTK
ncbi:MAG: chromate transporter [Bacteroidales bacterium]|jgi:chromate transporter|nr:chromate transporter [Bacteroidales bacterium]